MKKAIFITAICVILFLIVYLPFKSSNIREDSRGNAFAGSQKCIKCHASIYNSYLHTAHYLSSLPATEKNVHGNFKNGLNVFVLNDSQKIVMQKLDSGLFQTYYLNGKIKERYKFDIVFGGIKGESYLYWKNNELYQLPISYYTREDEWSTSPGYGLHFLDYHQSRSIRKQCMECHTSFINDLPDRLQTINKNNKNEEFNKSSLVFAIDCERCHGPAEQHVNFQTNNTEVKTAHFITTYNSLNRIQKIDMCATCHSGISKDKVRSTFEFVPGDSFSNFKIPQFYTTVDTSHLDVHGNQLQLLQSSKCYKFSKMDCATCHDPHQNNRGNDAVYVQKCLTCHNTPNHVYCKITKQLSNEALNANCINCHMPALTSQKISVQVSDKQPSIQFSVHTHHIATYPEEVKKMLAYINNN